MSGTDFERAAGREKAKKWKTSVRVLAESGKQGEMIGDYLQVRCCNGTHLACAVSKTLLLLSCLARFLLSPVLLSMLVAMVLCPTSV